MLLKPVLDSIFGLPPVEKRWMLGPQFPLRFFFREPEYRKECDDTYIYYLVARTTFIVCGGLSALSLVSQEFGLSLHFYFFDIALTGQDYVQTFLRTYCKYTATILLLFVLPYYIALFRYHFNPRLFDVTWWNPRPIKLKTMNAADVWVYGIVLCAVTIFGMYGLFAWPWFYMRGHGLQGSYPFFLLCLVMLPLFFSFLCRTLVVFVMIFWRYTGEHCG